MKVKIEDVSLFANGGKCEVQDQHGKSLEIVGPQDEDLESGSILLVLDQVSIEIPLHDLIDGLLPFASRYERDLWRPGGSR